MPRGKPTSTTDRLLNEKMKILADFCIVTSQNQHLVYNYLRSCIIEEPTKNPQKILDRAARSLIMGKVKI